MRSFEARGSDEDHATLAIGVVHLKNPVQTLEEVAEKDFGRIEADRQARMIESGRTGLAGRQVMWMRYSISKPGVVETPVASELVSDYGLVVNILRARLPLRGGRDSVLTPSPIRFEGCRVKLSTRARYGRKRSR